MSTPSPESAALIGPQAVAIASADFILAAVGLPTYSTLISRFCVPAGPLPAGVASLDAARADREQAKRLEGRL